MAKSHHSQRASAFASFYRGFSSITAPCTALPRKGLKCLHWNPKAEQLSTQLQTAFFTSAPSSNTLIPRSRLVWRWMPLSPVSQRYCLSFSESTSYILWCFSPKNSLALNSIMTLVVKLALEEWQHWLAGATDLFTIFTDHKILESLKSAKRLDPHQARWSFFFTWIQFTRAYRLDLKNTKADSLFCISPATVPVQDPEPILPSVCFVNVLT